MAGKTQTKEISGWYQQKESTAEEKAAQMREIGRWYEKKLRRNYRTVPLEIPGKMMLALGKMARSRGVSFSEFIEEILNQYLRKTRS